MSPTINDCLSADGRPDQMLQHEGTKIREQRAAATSRERLIVRKDFSTNVANNALRGLALAMLMKITRLGDKNPNVVELDAHLAREREAQAGEADQRHRPVAVRHKWHRGRIAYGVRREGAPPLIRASPGSSAEYSAGIGPAVLNFSKFRLRQCGSDFYKVYRAPDNLPGKTQRFLTLVPRCVDKIAMPKPVW